MQSKRFLIAATVLAHLFFPAIVGAQENSAQPPRVTPELRERCVKVLRDALQNEERWVKVHAAEHLLALGYPQDVREAFEAELAAHGEEPQYRIGVWRVLARTWLRPDQRKPWIERIRNAFLDADGPDRLHAVETLGKLGYTIPEERKEAEEDKEAFEKAAGSADRAFAAYAQWSLVQSAGGAGQKALAALLESDDERARGTAAYVLRNLPNVSAETLRTIQNAARGESADSSARVYMLSAAFARARDDSETRSFKNALLEYAKTGDKGQKYETAAALAVRGNNDDLPVLIGLLDDPETDARVGAAHAILRIERRAPKRLAPIDWIVIAVYALSMLAVGWHYARRTKTAEDYHLGGRRMKSWAVGLSLFASLLSTLSYLAWPGELIKHGPMILSQATAYPFVVLTVGWLIIPRIMRLRVTSAYEILEKRFGVSVRMLGASIFLSLRFLWMALIIYATTDKVLIPTLGLDPKLGPWLCVALGVITVVYTSMGGLRAVVFTDVAQTLILFGGAVLSVVFITRSLGGVAEWWPAAWAEHWQEPKLGFETGHRVTLGWAFVSAFVWYVCTSGSDQMAIQRYLATRDVKAARRTIITSMSADATVLIFLAMLGFALLAFFRANPHMIPDGQTIEANADQLFPQYIVFGLPAGISGLVIAGLLAAAMSSLSSGVNSSCSVFTVDFLDRFRGRKRRDAEQVKTARWVSVFIGAAVIVLTFLVGQAGGNLLEKCFRVVNLLVAPLFVLFFHAMFVRRATTFGAWVGGICAIVAAILIAYWEPITGSKGPTFLWIMPGSLVVGIVAGALANLAPIGEPRPPLSETADEAAD
ncbi:MAG TPA: sodium/solute symporter [Sumerlaeia bacterium]|nr:sodium/solute symporter [Sumerlaeia bacterium]